MGLPAAGYMALLPSGVGSGELLVLCFAVLLLFGPRKLPGIARSLGRFLSELRRTSESFKDHLMSIEADVTSDATDTHPSSVATDDVPPEIAMLPCCNAESDPPMRKLSGGVGDDADD